MSLRSRFLFAVTLVFALFAYADAHAWLSSPSPRGQYVGKRADFEYAPTVGNTPDSEEFVCRNDPVMPKANWLPLTAGKSQSINIDFNAKHPGDCFVYLTYDGDKPTNQMKWFKIWEQHECYKKSNYDVAIPSYLPSGEHVIFRWEWYALHVHPIVEYYAQCVDATMTGSNNGALPSPQVNIPGHLPHSAGNIMDDTNNYWWPYDNQRMFFTGPAVATLNGQTPATNAPTVKATEKPTAAPTAAATPKPTEKATAAPTAAATSRPTEKATAAPTPAATSRPTEQATVAPTPAATSRPTEQATAAPTPAATSRPTVRPPTASTSKPVDSVKLNIRESASVWWFSTLFAGSQSDDVVRAEIKDSANGATFKAMSIGWSDNGQNVWVFDPQGSMIVEPFTINAYLASGASVSFTQAKISDVIVDSGANFA